MRISDWSSDVCSSDLHALLGRGPSCRLQPFRTSLAHLLLPGAPGLCGGQQRSQCLVALKQEGDAFGVGKERAQVHLCAPRSEEHTSELQSLMRISYAVFCLKKKKTKQRVRKNTQQNKRN